MFLCPIHCTSMESCFNSTLFQQTDVGTHKQPVSDAESLMYTDIEIVNDLNTINGNFSLYIDFTRHTYKALNIKQ